MRILCKPPQKSSHTQLLLNLLQAASSFELAFPPPQYGGGPPLYPIYVRGQAYLLLRQGQQAAFEFQKLLDHRKFSTLNGGIDAPKSWEQMTRIAETILSDGREPEVYDVPGGCWQYEKWWPVPLSRLPGIGSS